MFINITVDFFHYSLITRLVSQHDNSEYFFFFSTFSRQINPVQTVFNKKYCSWKLTLIIAHLNSLQKNWEILRISMAFRTFCVGFENIYIAFYIWIKLTYFCHRVSVIVLLLDEIKVTHGRNFHVLHTWNIHSNDEKQKG